MHLCRQFARSKAGLDVFWHWSQANIKQKEQGDDKNFR